MFDLFDLLFPSFDGDLFLFLRETNKSTDTTSYGKLNETLLEYFLLK